MSDMEVSLTNLLQTIAPVYPLYLPEQRTYPAIVYQRISTPKERTHDGSGFERPRYQLSIYAKTYVTCRTTAASIEAILDTKGASGIMFALQATRMDVIETETGLFRIILEYIVWNNQP